MNRSETLALLERCELERTAHLSAGRSAREAHDAAAGLWNTWARELQAEMNALKEAGDWKNPRDPSPRALRWLNRATTIFSVPQNPTTFNHPLDFSDWVFPGPAVFLGAKFPQRVAFSRSQFCFAANFEGGAFDQYVTFASCKFGHFSYLWRGATEVDDPLGEYGYINSWEANFHNCSFSSGGSFESAKFRYLPNFEKAKLTSVSFAGATWTRDRSKETIVLVHGTFDSPLKPGPKWYRHSCGEEASKTFADRLDSRLEELGSSARCWAHVVRKNEFAQVPLESSFEKPAFGWTGANSWLERSNAAFQLAKYLGEVSRAGYRVHVIAHSHGGNIIRQALSQFGDQFNAQGAIVTMGTPFMDEIPQRIPSQRGQWIGLVALLVLVLLAFKVFLDAATSHVSNDWQLADRSWAMAGLVLAIVVLILAAAARVGMPGGRHRKNASRSWNIKCLSSPKDEAWQLLNHTRERAGSIFKPQALTNFLGQAFHGRWVLSQQTNMHRGRIRLVELSSTSKFLLILAVAAFSAAILLRGHASLVVRCAMVLAPLLGCVAVDGVSAFSALAAPARWLKTIAVSILALPKDIIAYLVRQRVGQLVQEQVLGLSGYPGDIPSISRVAPPTPGMEFHLVDLPEEVEKRVIGKRGSTVAARIEEAGELLTTAVLGSNDIQGILEIVEGDWSLLHSAYHQDDWCLERIAEWIKGCGSEPSELPVSQWLT